MKKKNPPSQIRIDSSQNNFEITYTALSFINSENLKFKYFKFKVNDGEFDSNTANSFDHRYGGQRRADNHERHDWKKAGGTTHTVDFQFK